MRIYTLDDDFSKEEYIEDFSSAIWVERFKTPGEVTLIIDATPDNISNLARGKFLHEESSKEVMMIKTQSVENGKLTITGPSLLKFTEDRVIRTNYLQSVHEDTMVTNPANGMVAIVQLWLMSSVYNDGTIDTGLIVDVERITNVRIDPDALITGTTVNIPLPYTDMYSILAGLAEKYGIGMTLYLDDINHAPGDYILYFKTYVGLDRTSDQTDRDVVRFSSKMNTLDDIKELDSQEGYKNVCYAFLANTIYGTIARGVAYTDGAISAEDFDRHTMMIFCTDPSDQRIDDEVMSSAAVTAELTAQAQDALANNAIIQMVDGTIPPQSQYAYGVDYGLGDIVELEGKSGFLQKAQITEFIRSADATGERSYPTVSIVD